MKNKVLGLLIFPLVVSVNNQSSSRVETTVKTEVSGSNASVKSQISNNINGVKTEINSTQPGEIKISVKDGQVEVFSTPTLFATSFPKQEVEKEIQTLETQIHNLIDNFLKNFLGFIKIGA